MATNTDGSAEIKESEIKKESTEMKKESTEEAKVDESLPAGVQDANGEATTSVENPPAEEKADGDKEKKVHGPIKCNLCDEEISDMRTAGEHINGKPHKRKLELHFIEKCVKKETCELCGTHFTSLTQVFDHLSGFEHASNTVASRKPKLFANTQPRGRGVLAGRGGAVSRGRGMLNGVSGGVGRGGQRGGGRGRGVLTTRGVQRGGTRGGNQGPPSRGMQRGGPRRGGMLGNSRGGRGGGGKMPSFDSRQNRAAPYGRGNSTSVRGLGQSHLSNYQVGSSLRQLPWASQYGSSYDDNSIGDYSSGYGSSAMYGEYGASFRDSWYSGVDDLDPMAMEPPPLPPF